MRRESIPDTLRPPPAYRPTPTPLQEARRAASDALATWALLHPTGIGAPLSARSVAMLGLPCPGGWESNNGYCSHGCRCERCRVAHRKHRLGQIHRARIHRARTQAAA